MQPKLNNNTSDLSLDGLEGLLDSDGASESGSIAGTVSGAKTTEQDWTV